MLVVIYFHMPVPWETPLPAHCLYSMNMHCCSSEVLVYQFIRKPPAMDIMVFQCRCVFTTSSILQISSSLGFPAIAITFTYYSLREEGTFCTVFCLPTCMNTICYVFVFFFLVLFCFLLDLN